MTTTRTRKPRQKKPAAASEAAYCATPNQHARPPGVELLTSGAIVHGYQDYVATREHVLPNDNDLSLHVKYALLKPYLNSDRLTRKTVLDVGANGGFFSLLSVQSKAARAYALDIDETYLDLIRKVTAHLGVSNIETSSVNFEDWTEPADVVIALAMVHWLYSCTARFGSLNGVVSFIADLTREFAVIEWVSEDDPAIGFFGHTGRNPQFVSAPYNRKNFEAALAEHFHSYEYLGDITPTRQLFVAFKRSSTIDLSVPLPLLAPEGTLLSCRPLWRTEEDLFWSITYDLGDRVLKQTTNDLARREARLLGLLDAKCFPTVLEQGEGPGYTWFSMTRMEGQPLTSLDASAFAMPTARRDFARGCLRVLAHLEEHSISHNDIRPENLVVKGGQPFLLDFGWASSPELPLPQIPAGLGTDFRVPDGSLSDVYSMGRVLKGLPGECPPALGAVFDLMCADSADRRITDVGILDALLSIAIDDRTSMDYSRTVLKN
jgi:SAM-dependent methyltransferase